MSDQPPYQPPGGYDPSHQQPGGDMSNPPWPSQPYGAMPPSYPPPPEHYTRENYPPPPDPAPRYPPSGGYPPYPQYPQYPQQGMYGAPGYAPPMPREQGSGMAIAGLILGIISVPAAFVPICGLIAGILGIIFSALGRRSVDQRRAATFGLTLAVIGVVISVAYSVFSFYFALTHPGLFPGLFGTS